MFIFVFSILPDSVELSSAAITVVELSAAAVELSVAAIVVELSEAMVVAVELSAPATVVGATVVSSPYILNMQM